MEAICPLRGYAEHGINGAFSGSLPTVRIRMSNSETLISRSSCSMVSSTYLARRNEAWNTGHTVRGTAWLRLRALTRGPTFSHLLLSAWSLEPSLSVRISRYVAHGRKRC